MLDNVHGVTLTLVQVHDAVQFDNCVLRLPAVLVHCLTDTVLQVYESAADQTTLTLALAAANTSMSTLDSVSLRVTQSALSSQLEPSAAVVSAMRMPEQQATLHSSCNDSGLQSSVEWRQVTLVAGKATIEVHLLPECLRFCPAIQCVILHNV